jgi:hypothetical protein
LREKGAPPLNGLRSDATLAIPRKSMRSVQSMLPCWASTERMTETCFSPQQPLCLHTKIKICFILCVAFLYLIDMFTLKKAGSSGNGNPAFLFIIPYLFSSLYLAYLINKYLLLKCNTNRRIRYRLGIPFILLVLGSFYWKDQYKKTAEMIVNGHPADYAKDIMGSLNIFTNTMYFNYGSFVMLISASVLLVTVFHVVKKK